MNLPPDIMAKVKKLFHEEEHINAGTLLESAKMHDGSTPSPRCLRCALVASEGSLAKLKYYADLLSIDYRDVIVAGEYEICEGKLVRVRNLNEPFE